MADERRHGPWFEQRAAQALWLVATPGIFAVLGLRFLVPDDVGAEASRTPAFLRFAMENPLLVGVALFLVVGWLVRYWSFLLPGGQYLTPRSEIPKKPAGARTQLRQAVVLVAWVLFAGSAAMLLRSAGLETYRVLGNSMLPTLESGDCIVASKSAYGVTVPFLGRLARAETPRRGDLVVFERKADARGADAEHLIKRVVGVPGDHIKMRGGHPQIDGWQVPSCDAGTYLHAELWGGVHGRLVVEYLGDQTYLTVHTPETVPFPDEYVVQPGEVFVLGDNRNGSTDSRAWNGGRGAGVSLSDVEGAAKRFLLGTHRDDTVDLRRFLTHFGTTVHLEGLDIEPLVKGIARCLAQRPKVTNPPTPASAPLSFNGRRDSAATPVIGEIVSDNP